MSQNAQSSATALQAKLEMTKTDKQTKKLSKN